MQALVVPFLVAYWAVCEYALRAESLRGVFDAGVLELTQYVLIAYTFVWFPLMGFTASVMRRQTDGPVWLGHLTVQLYALPNLYAAYLLGPVTSPFLVVLLGSGLLGLLTFPPRIAWTAVITASLGLLGMEVARVLDIVPYSPLLRVAPQDDERVMHFWSGLMWFIVVSVSALLFTLFHVLLDELRKREAALHQLTRTDALTSLYNRRHFMQQLGNEHARATRYSRPLSCMMVDLDHFKRINDEHGHAVGDIVLRETAARLRQALRETDVLARLGGEEFGALLPDTDLDGARRVAERCRELLGGAPIQVEGRPSVRVTASFGVAQLDAVAAPGPEDLLRAADMALYASKGRGRNRVSLADVSLADVLGAPASLAADAGLDPVGGQGHRLGSDGV
ncbi:MAG: GGDEF domain-containing protein [Myxococcales bacterium]|nr:GGDEF domain-containing protein [Myxococcales bacterium]